MEKGQTYYLSIQGKAAGRYTLVSSYAIGNVSGTTSPIKFIGEDSTFNKLIETQCTLWTYDAREFVATLHLKDWASGGIEATQFSLSGVSADDYLVGISRPGYLTRYSHITLNDDAIDLGHKSLLAGDVNNDGIIDAADRTIVMQLSGAIYGDTNYQVSADLNGDKVIDQKDLNLLLPNIGKNANIYNENVNVITFNTSVDNYILTISGSAKPDSTVVCNVYHGGISLSDQEIVCDADGNFNAAAILSKTGNYHIVVTAENRAFDAVADITCN